MAETDSEKLSHVLQNLIDNAIKFTGKGQVTISARIIKESALVPPCAPALLERSGGATGNGGRWAEFEVADTGVGIPEESLPFIFEMFRHGDGARPKSSDGVGLGLHIVKKFTELLGGDVGVESERGKGSTFTVLIPCERKGHQAENF